MIKILIGISVLNNIEITRACLQHLYRNTETNRLDLNVSVLIADNGSESDVECILGSEFQEAAFPIYFLRNPQNAGAAVAWNQILKFAPEKGKVESLHYDYCVISNNDTLFGVDWLRPLVEAMENDKTIGWISAMENGSPVLSELIEAHSLSKKYRIDPKTPYTTEVINKGLELIYEKWGGHDLFCRLVENKQLPLFIPYRKDG